MTDRNGVTLQEMRSFSSRKHQGGSDASTASSYSEPKSGDKPILPVVTQEPMLSPNPPAEKEGTEWRERHPGEDDEYELTETTGWEVTAFAFPNRKKWKIITQVFLIQCSMNFNASVYSSGVPFIAEKFGVTKHKARRPQMAFLIAYGIGCELWAPYSEEFGRWPIMQLSIGLINAWQFLCLFAPKYKHLLAGRILGGFCSAGGSVTLGIVADMWKENKQQRPCAFVVFSSVLGSVIGPLVGGFLEQYADYKAIWLVQIGFSVFVQCLHFWLVPETNTQTLLTEEARRLRCQSENSPSPKPYSKAELESKTQTFGQKLKYIVMTTYRPFWMLACEPVVLSLSLLSGFSDALIFSFLESFGMVFKQWGFSAVALGQSFWGITIGYCIAYASFFYAFRRNDNYRAQHDDNLPPRQRMWWLLYTAALLPIGILGFAFTSWGPEKNHWFGPLFFSVLIGIANFSIYMGTIDYMVAVYGRYAACATGGNGFCRDVLAGVAALYTNPLYENIHGPSTSTLVNGSFILFCCALILYAPLCAIYRYSDVLIEKSRYCKKIEHERGQEVQEVRKREAEKNSVQTSQA